MPEFSQLVHVNETLINSCTQSQCYIYLLSSTNITACILRTIEIAVKFSLEKLKKPTDLMQLDDVKSLREKFTKIKRSFHRNFSGNFTFH